VLRPRLRMSMGKPCCRQTVTVDESPAVILRVHVENRGFFAAQCCRVVVREIRFNASPVDTEPSPLQWMDEPEPTYEKKIARHDHAYADVCLRRKDLPTSLFVRSARGRKGYNFNQSGVYTFSLTLEADKLFEGSNMELEVRNGQQWDDLNVVADRQERVRFRWNG